MAKRGGGNQPYGFWARLLRSVPGWARGPFAIFIFLITVLFHFVFPNQQPAMKWALVISSLLMAFCIFGLIWTGLRTFMATAIRSDIASRVFTPRERAIAGKMILLEKGQIEGTDRYISGQLSRVSQDSVLVLLRKIES